MLTIRQYALAVFCTLAVVVTVVSGDGPPQDSEPHPPPPPPVYARERTEESQVGAKSGTPETGGHWLGEVVEPAREGEEVPLRWPEQMVATILEIGGEHFRLAVDYPHGRYRYESLEEGNQRLLLLRKDLGRMWSILRTGEGGCTYQPYTGILPKPEAKQAQYLGTKMIKDKVCHHWKIIEPYAHYFVEVDTGIPVRFINDHVNELSDVVLGDPDHTIFNPPANCRAHDGPGEGGRTTWHDEPKDDL